MKFYVAIMLSILSFSVLADRPMKIGTGGTGGSYYPMGGDMVEFCSAEVSRPMEIVEQSAGSVGNILDMVNKKLHAGITQIDVLKYYKRVMGEKVNGNRMKVITGLHREAGHLLIPTGWEPSSSGFNWGGMLSAVGIGNSNNGKGIDINALKGQTVGAWGGSLVSVKALSSFLQLGLNSVEIKPGQLADHPILVVSGQPSKTVEGYLAKGYRLIPIDAATLKARASFYDAVTLNYVAAGKVTSVPSFGIRAVLIGKSSRSPSRNKPMSELATCVRKNLADLADDGDTNPNWESVYEFENDDSQIDWSYFPLVDSAQ